MKVTIQEERIYVKIGRAVYQIDVSKEALRICLPPTYQEKAELKVQIENEDWKIGKSVKIKQRKKEEK